jgi:hypothetical protein
MKKTKENSIKYNEKNENNLKKLLDNINKSNIPTKDNVKYNKDPYLDNTDKQSFTKIGSGFTICFKQDKKKLSCSYNKRKVEEKLEEDKKKQKEEELKRTNTPKNTIRHNKILQIVEKFSNDSDCDKKFLQVLNKLDLYDLKGLHIAIINYEPIPILQKQVLIKTIGLFKNLLQKKMDQGYELHNEKKISDIVSIL